MQLSVEKLKEAMNWSSFPLSAQYDVVQVANLSMGPNVLWLTEGLAACMTLRPGSRVLDLGCGRALSSIFLARQFHVAVWAVDLWVKVTTNWQTIREAGLERQVIPLHADARNLPFADNFFDAILSLDSYHYFGTDVHCLPDVILPLLKPGGQVGIVSPAAVTPLPDALPEGLESWVYTVNTVDWWRGHWSRVPGVKVEVAEAVPGGREMWIRWDEAMLVEGMQSNELDLLRSEIGKHLGFVRMVARRTC